MRRVCLCLALIFSLSGCQTVAGDIAAQVALDNLMRPIVDLTVEGGKAAYQVAEKYWNEITKVETEADN